MAAELLTCDLTHRMRLTQEPLRLAQPCEQENAKIR
jgi:hypothetical protein